MVKGFT
jgi:hypothetical protein